MELPPNEQDVDYKEMYLKMVRASEEAIRVLIRAQRECEEMYLDAAGPPIEDIRAARDERKK